MGRNIFSRRKMIFALLILLLYSAFRIPHSAFLFAQEPPVMAQVRKNYSGANAITAAFDHSVYWSVREKEEKKSGELIIAPGEKFKITLGREAFISDGKTYWQYSERNSQVVIRHASEIDAATLPSRILSSFLTGRKFTEQKRGGAGIELSWDGKGRDVSGDGYTKITATVEEKTGIIKTLKLTDKNNNVHTYTFKKTTFGKPPKDDIFKFTTPKGTETVDLREGR